MKQTALLGFVWVALLLPSASGRKLGATNTALTPRSAFAGEGRAPLDLDALEVSVLRLANASSSSRSYLKPMIDSIRTMLEKELMPDIRRQYSLAQKMLNDASKGFAACKEPWNATQVGQVRDQHQNCRSEENNLVDQVKATCDDAENLEAVKGEKCNKLKGVDSYPEEAPAICDKDASDVSYEVHARRIRNFYMQKVHDWVLAEEGCTNATKIATAARQECTTENETWREKRSSCTAVQRMLDMSTCDAWTEFFHCSKNNSCLTQATEAYLDANSTATAMRRSFALQWRAMKRIECLLDALEFNPNADELNDAINECRTKVHNAKDWTLTYPYYKDWKPRMPSEGKVCEEPTFDMPGKQSYQKTEYETLPSKAPAEACAADCCTKCWYFSCNSTSVAKPKKDQLVGFSQEECCMPPANPAWKYDPWPDASCVNSCGQAAQYEDRKVECRDLDTKSLLDDSVCGDPKPEATRTKCYATPACGICEDTDCAIGYVMKELVPSACRGEKCTAEECCNKVCSADDCPVGTAVRFPARICDGEQCDASKCCLQTEWKSGPWPQIAQCPTECGKPDQMVNRSVTCEDTAGHQVDDNRCAGAKPAVTQVGCAATQACPDWLYSPWGENPLNCSERDCGLGQEIQERPVTCTEPSTGKAVADALCKGAKPDTVRVLCPPTPLCVTTTTTFTTTTSTSTTTLMTCEFFSCPRGYWPKATGKHEQCKGSPCQAEDCCDVVAWAYKSWDDSTECNQTCGLKDIVETRKVTCQVTATGKLMSRGACQGTAPVSERTLCPATADCNGCGGVWCGTDAVPLPLTHVPDCGSSCTRDLCCKKFATGFQAAGVGSNTSAVSNQGTSGGSVQFTGEPAQPSGEGHSYRLGGKTGLVLGGTASSEFTAVMYIKLLGSDNAKEETVMLKEGGPDDYGAWELVTTSLKQLRIRSFKDSQSEASIGCLCLSSYADEWAAVAVRYDGLGKRIELVVNGKVCCEAAATSDPSWADTALQNGSAPVHLGLVPGSRRPGVSGEVSSVQLWDGALTDADLDHLVAQFSEVLAWSKPQQLSCPADILSIKQGVSSLAACRVFCSQDQRCKSVQYQAKSQTCELRSTAACTRAEGCQCDANAESLTSNHCPGGSVVAPVTAQPDKLAHYPVTCTGVAKTPFWQQPPNMTTSTSSSGGAGTSGNGPGGSGTASTTSSSSVAWVYTSWDESKECEQICGLKEIRETRSVTCQVKGTGKMASRSSCPQPEPAAERLVCPATRACDTCSSVWCGADAVPLTDEVPDCGSSCTRDLCCKKFATGFQAASVSANASAVANQGSSGGSVQFDGEPAQPSEGGHSYHLGGKTGLVLGGTGTAEFTAVIYVKLNGTDKSKEQTLMLKEGGPGDSGAWELIATSQKQLGVRSFKDSTSQTAIGCLCQDAYADQWAAVSVRYDGLKMQLVINGEICCMTAAADEPLWSDQAISNSSAPVHVGYVPGSKRPGVVGDVSGVQLWDGALTDADLDHLLAQFSEALAWSDPQQLRCPSDIFSTKQGVASLAACRALCSEDQRCESVQYQASSKTCELRNKEACTRAEGCACDASSDTLASTHCPGGRVVAPVTDQPDKLAHYPVTCTGVAKTPFWKQPGFQEPTTSSSNATSSGTSSGNGVAWVYTSWDESKECEQTCGLKEIRETRSVTCQVKGTGKPASPSSCPQPEPAAERLVCPATKACDTCSSIWCGTDAVPLTTVPDCGSSCTRDLCCKKFATGFQAANAGANASAVANQGSSGGSVQFDGEPVQPSEGGHSYNLGGKTGLVLGGTSSPEFTAVIYVKLIGTDKTQEQTVMLKEGGPGDSGAWELIATPQKQLGVRSFKDSTSQTSIGCVCQHAYADQWAAASVRYDGIQIELVVNGEICCTTSAADELLWADDAISNSSAPVHVGFVPGSKRPGFVGDVSGVQLWDGALTDADLDHLLAQFSEALAWSQPQQLHCPFDILSTKTGVASLAACRAICNQDQSCKSVQYQARSQTCELRSKEACTRAQGCPCDESKDSLASTHCPDGSVVAPVTSQPDKLAHYPVTCTGAAKTPFWQQPGFINTTSSSSTSSTSSTSSSSTGGTSPGTSASGSASSGSPSTSTSTSTTTTTIARASCKQSTCPGGFVAKPANKTGLCKTDKCQVDECCDPTMWVYLGWDDTQECNHTCGMDETIETRSVTCQVPAKGKIVSKDKCQDAEPSSKRALCPATADCQSCGGIICGADEVPMSQHPACGSSCSRDVCCKKSVTAIQVVDMRTSKTSALKPVSTVANRGSKGGSLTIAGDAAEQMEQGHAYHLNGKNGLSLGVTKSAEFTALAYMKLIGNAKVSEEVVMLKEGGPGEHGAWELVTTSLQQFRLRAYKDSTSQATIGCLCLSSYSDEWASVAVRYDGNGEKLQLMVNGRVCCEAVASTEPSWSDAALQKSDAAVHFGLVPGGQRPGATAEVHAVQLWDTALSDSDMAHLTAQFSQATTTWSRNMQLDCDFNIVSTRKGVISMAACRALCTRTQSCKSIQYHAGSDTCELRRVQACTKKEGCACDESGDTLASNHCPGGDVVAPVTADPDMAQYPVTCAAAAEKPWWRKS